MFIFSLSRDQNRRLEASMKLTRRRFLEVAALAGAGIAIGYYFDLFSGRKDADGTVENGDDEMSGPSDVESNVYMVKTSDRLEGLESLLGQFDMSKYSFSRVLGHVELA